ncbi:MAG: alpha/beta hydrolase [Pseudomonadota bacterium]
MNDAPFFAGIADAGPSARAVWAAAPDGYATRVAHLGGGPKGTVLLFPGRTEYVEKYGPGGRELAARGYGCVAVDWRGQGLTERFLPDAALGHVPQFSDYQADVAALVASAEAWEMPRPWHLIGHSMGGAIGLRALYDGLPVASAAFSGPMWGIALNPVLRPLAQGISGGARALGLGNRLAPGSDRANYILTAPFEDNTLTTSPDRYAWMREQLTAHPELALGGPTLHWVNEALAEIGRLEREPAPKMPGLCVTGSNERIVEIPSMRTRMEGWLGGRLIEEEGAEHELMMERDDVRTRFFDTVTAHFDAAA